ncbi:MAG: preprotein translocase subunit SecA, partial [Candidatus Aenigmatarchaeota archaeon]
INFDIRKNLLEYDEVMNKHREFFYKMRREILLADYDALKRNLEEFVKEAGFNVEDLKRKEEEFGKENFFKIGKYYSLSVFDSFWVDYLETMEHLRDSVKLRAYGNLDPLVEYKREGNFLFKKMISEIKKTIGKGILSIHIKPKREERVKIEGKKVGRNDPCPCGSGKKYKKCCWPKYGY